MKNALVLAALSLALITSACSTPTAPATPAVTRQAKGVEVTVKAVEVAQSIDTMGLVPAAPEGAIYVHVTYTLKNTGTGAISMDVWPQARLVDPAGNKLTPEVYASTALSAAANTSWAETLNPNLSTEGQLVWKVDQKSFDRAKWKLIFLAKPQLDFPLQ